MVLGLAPLEANYDGFVDAVDRIRSVHELSAMINVMDVVTRLMWGDIRQLTAIVALAVD